MAPVLRGRDYYLRYFYIPALKQYLVYSGIDEMREQIEGDSDTLLDEEGDNVLRFETPLRFSYRSGCFYGPSSYIPLLETGKKEHKEYDKIHNQDLGMGKRDFEKLFIQLYSSSEYVEYINLRASNDNLHQAGIIFRRQGKVEILLSGLKDSRMICYFEQNSKTNNFDDYYLPDVYNKQTFPQSEPSIGMVPLETKNTNPFIHWRFGFNREFSIQKYKNQESSGLQGIGMFGFIPIYVPGESSGTAYVRFKIKGEIFRIKILEVCKISFIPNYNLGLRTFQLPKKYRNKKALVFMESAQNSGSNRLGGGMYVVRNATSTNSFEDLPRT